MGMSANSISTCNSSDSVRSPQIAKEQKPTSRSSAYATNFVPQSIEMRAAMTPGAIALSEGQTVTTYAELSRRSNQFAHYLNGLGVGPDTLVALCLSRSLPQIWSALAILKAGGAYVPLDPSYPVERLTFMLQDAAPRVLITNREMAELLPTGPWCTVVIDRDLHAIELESPEAPASSVTGENLAYVIYTSGSTGKPKGVEITHRNLLDYVFGLDDRTKISDCKSFALVSSIATDLGN